MHAWGVNPSTLSREWYQPQWLFMYAAHFIPWPANAVEMGVSGPIDSRPIWAKLNSLIQMGCCREPIAAVGVAKPRTHGQAMTMAEIPNWSANSKLSMEWGIQDFGYLWNFPTSWTICDRALSDPTCVVSTCTTPSSSSSYFSSTNDVPYCSPFFGPEPLFFQTWILSSNSIQ